jgi:hypothetical protein
VKDLRNPGYVAYNPKQLEKTQRAMRLKMIQAEKRKFIASRIPGRSKMGNIHSD